LQAYLPDYIRAVPLEMPGRGRRLADNLMRRAHLVVDDLYRSALPYLDKPYAIFGHSMGSLLGFLLTRRILQERQPPPLHLFVSGRAGPSRECADCYHTLPGTEFFSAVRRLGGCPDELFGHPDVIDLFEPVLRADFELVETYRHERRPPFEIPVDVFYGREEGLEMPELEAWAEETTLPVTYTSFGGDHFFILSRPACVSEKITQKLNQYFSI
jgi:surfactin synthase thioesterase subunit